MNNIIYIKMLSVNSNFFSYVKIIVNGKNLMFKNNYRVTGFMYNFDFFHLSQNS